ncbi:MAG: hypothetical protein QXU18_06120 [Thermoplasmatales archaeon]
MVNFQFWKFPIEESEVLLLYLRLGGENISDKENNDNHSNQLNPNNDAYWESRGYEERLEDWEKRVEEKKDDKDK